MVFFPMSRHFRNNPIANVGLFAAAGLSRKQHAAVECCVRAKQQSQDTNGTNLKQEFVNCLKNISIHQLCFMKQELKIGGFLTHYKD